MIQGNYIGTDYTGTAPLGNEHHGVQITVVDGNSIGGIIVDGGSFDWLGAKHRYKTMVEPNASYNGLVLAETFGDFAFAIACRVMGLRDTGPAIAPMNAFLILNGVETLSLRMARHCENAAR